MPDYNNSKIYKLFSYENDLVYIGSTTQKLCERLRKHKLVCNESSSKILFENSSNVKIELIEKFPCECKEELLKREGYFIRQIDCVNKRIEGRTMKEWCEDCKDQIKERKKEWREGNKEELKKKSKEYYEEHKEQIKEYQKKYSEEHKEQIKEYKKQWDEDNKECMKKYREEHKEHIKEREAKLYTCDCGKTLRFGGKARHERTKFHIKYCEEKK